MFFSMAAAPTKGKKMLAAEVPPGICSRRSSNCCLALVRTNGATGTPCDNLTTTGPAKKGTWCYKNGGKTNNSQMFLVHGCMSETSYLSNFQSPDVFQPPLRCFVERLPTTQPHRVGPLQCHSIKASIS